MCLRCRPRESGDPVITDPAVTLGLTTLAPGGPSPAFAPRHAHMSGRKRECGVRGVKSGASVPSPHVGEGQGGGYDKHSSLFPIRCPTNVAPGLLIFKI